MKEGVKEGVSKNYHQGDILKWRDKDKMETNAKSSQILSSSEIIKNLIKFYE